MSKSKRLLELMMTVNRKRKFTVKELAREFGVSSRTILRDLQELGEIGVPLYSEVGPHGGYQVLNERVLPPIAFTEEEAVALFFASHALRHYADLPFETESSAALSKFYHYMPGDVRDRIDRMKNRVDFIAPTRLQKSPHLSVLLDGAVRQRVVRIAYESGGSTSDRLIQPVGIFANSGLWYCPAYCFLRSGYRLFRCDRIHAAEFDPSAVPLNLGDVDLGNWEDHRDEPLKYVYLRAELTREGVQRCEAELWHSPKAHVREDGSGWLAGHVPERDIGFFAKLFVGWGLDVTVHEPPAVVERMKRQLDEIKARYPDT
ncbi:helix-turn-helix transcriptional regulator [Cohnella nanjingensis]|uniref:YafY family transcriptional regulator n=1 Tax=Cohnella nanjingensis TaxID=1387779 RepID=A0A7X0RU25_9BACL|nr:YafY family protein [Cohnella nanjingensis]MBB6673697.1 YafY family transcriptional regulator [Cohnella nanjingensis]